MFKPGEKAIVNPKDAPRGEATILATKPRNSKLKWPVATSLGVFDESELHPAHPSVLATAMGRNPAMEAFDEKFKTRRAEREVEGGAPFEILYKVQKAMEGATLETNGHWKGGAILDKEYVKLRPFLVDSCMSKEDAEALLQAAKSGKPLDRWVPMDAGLSLTGLRSCTYCGEDGFETETNGIAFRITGRPCEFPNGLPPTEWELNVPSGKLVVANDLRLIFPLPEDGKFEMNTNLGCRQTALAYAANGMSHASVGNTSPGVYKCGEGLYKIANEPGEERWDEKKEEWVPIKPAPKFEGEKVASICTDLWWYSICDHDEYQRRLKHFKQKPKNFRGGEPEFVTVKPGVYRFRHNEEARGHEEPGECVFAQFEWIREPDPVMDFLAQYQEAEVNAHAYVQAQAARWPTLYGSADPLNEKKTTVPWSRMTKEQRLHAWQRVADQVFCTIGSGTEWHDKGFPTAKVDPAVRDVEPPSFREQHHWYPFSKPYGGLFEPKKLNPSFARLAFRVLESVISFGTDVRDGEHSREVPYARERMLVAVKRYRELAKQYPDQADPEYVDWLSQKDRAEAWVEKFDLGPTFTNKHRKHAQKQRWVPEDAYAVEFDARNLKDGHFAGPHGWAHKKDAKRYAIVQWEDNGQAPEHNCFWTCHAINTAVPLYSVARVVKVGEVSHMGETLVEIAFDYGNAWMRDPKKRRALAEAKEKNGIRVLSRAEYEELLPKATEFFETA